MPGYLQSGMTAMWLIAMIVLLIVEGVVPGLVSIWFALGALAALLASILHAPLWLQIFCFLLVSVASLVLTRPLAKKYINARVQPTNADRILGHECIVTEEIDNLRGTGAVRVDGKEWTARAAEDSKCYAKGDVLRVLRIEGVKLIVQ